METASLYITSALKDKDEGQQRAKLNHLEISTCPIRKASK